MSTMTKVFIVLTSVLTVATSVLFIASAAQWANWKQLAEDYKRMAEAELAHRSNLQQVMEVALAVKEDAVQQVTAERDRAQAELQATTNDLTDAKNELARRTNEAVSSSADVKRLGEVLKVVTEEYTATQRQNQEYQASLIDLQTRNSGLNARVLELQTNVTVLGDETRNLREKLYTMEQRYADCQQQLASGARPSHDAETPRNVTAAQPAVAGPISGEVVQIDGTYASINIGSASGVTTGMRFLVHRGSTYLAELLIDTVQPDSAAGKLSMVERAVNEGDAVTYGLENVGG